jgi:hypothetical protein
MNIDSIRSAIEPHRQGLLNHPLYEVVQGEDALRVFMEHHVFAVWDFMSLLKKLQTQICCVTVPWQPPADRVSARMINEIVLAEETDHAQDGSVASHFDLYLHAMRQFGASTVGIESLLESLVGGVGLSEAIKGPLVPTPAAQFMQHTFHEIREGKLCRIASAFTFGREDLLPGVFSCLVDRLAQKAGGRLEPFQYYLNRHVELDGDSHGPMAEQLVSQLCGDRLENWRDAEDAAVVSLVARRKLWDGIYDACQALVSHK